ncbi:S8 family peptidase [Deinococcus roseus]|uniref:Peptidase S8 n=1 Tax=Deinococcus roseus TaxID=392414 RepID=A0ABQ2D062_9DEIO|nr:S8 family peptidase [Deinococcus roseus]GGJ38000.1 hypothetical protein GCM10008938_25140 [Deinococcus roseus]
MSRKIKLGFALLALTLGACAQQSLPETHDLPLPRVTTGEKKAPVLDVDPAAVVAQKYIVVLKKPAAGIAAQGILKLSRAAIAEKLGISKTGGQVQKIFTEAVYGFSAQLNAAQLAALAQNPQVSYIQPVQKVRKQGTQSNPPSWGLDRIDQRDLPLNNSYTYATDGSGVTAYVVDTGIQTSHSNFGGRASVGIDTVGDGKAGIDCDGHGTHVAGIIGSNTYGVAKNVKLVSVRVLDCEGSGSMDGVIEGIDWVIKNAKKPAVVNISLGSEADATLDQAVKNAIQSGLTVVLAAGNQDDDACKYSPARVPEALTVGATDSGDKRTYFSNKGSCVDLFAPGLAITSTVLNNQTDAYSGTSMAGPHVAGAVALYLAGHTSSTPAQVTAAILGNTTPNKVSDPAGSPNKLLYIGSEPVTTTPPPTTTGPCSGANCTTYTGKFNAEGEYYFPPANDYFEYSGGTLKAWMKGPSGTDFDLYLYKWNGSDWEVVGVSESPTSEESITYTGTSGYYIWLVTSYTGTGSYTFWMQK